MRPNDGWHSKQPRWPLSKKAAATVDMIHGPDVTRFASRQCTAADEMIASDIDYSINLERGEFSLSRSGIRGPLSPDRRSRKAREVRFHLVEDE
jgi:hypothetical protein